MQSLQSSVGGKGKIVDEIIHFSGGSKKTFRGVIADTIEQSEFTQFETLDGKRVYINTKNVDCFEVFRKEGEK